MHPLPETVIVAVMTCAAPMLKNGMEGLSQEQYETMVYDRITGMLKVAAYLGYKHLVLGAFGCGAFGNDATIVSETFQMCLAQYCRPPFDISRDFHIIDFAVLDHSEQQRNIKAFQAVFSKL